MEYVQDQLDNEYYSFQLTVNGEVRPFYTTNGKGTFVEINPGEEYVLEVKNKTYSRLEVVSAIDGRNTLKQEPAILSKISGMVIPASTFKNYFVYKIEGWRLNQSTLSKFVGTIVEDALAKKITGDTKHVGTIGIAVYKEKTKELPDFQYLQSKSPQTFRGSNTTKGGDLEGLSKTRSLGADVGTGMGQVVNSNIGTTNFERATTAPQYIIDIKYRSGEFLLKNGIKVIKEAGAFVEEPVQDTGYSQYLDFKKK